MRTHWVQLQYAGEMVDHPSRRIGVRELREQLAHLVHCAIAGERITITMRGNPVAVLGPTEPSQGVRPDMDTLASAGLVEPPRRRDQPVTPATLLLPADVRMDRVLDQLRGRS